MNRFPQPSEMMRARRPYLYSDSECIDAYRLTETEFSHHLDTLTDRNQHKDFEVFCRKLSERELCPNLRPQTGPEGGGDGKVDTETYPVDEQIAERWYVGNGRSGAERWGFAFSAKKTWSEKVRSDIKGIVETQRSYDRIIFITSRAARQRDRLRIEDELQQEYGVKVTIIDREWIIDRVFSHGHKDLAFEYLKAGQHEPDKVKLGPRDFERQQTLHELEVRIKKFGSSTQEKTQAASDTFEAARLSRELERPRFETDGRFQRAITYAKKYGTNSQHLRAIYEHAWTAFWWFDDIETIQEKYELVEAIAFASDHSVHISKVCNLHQLLVGRITQAHETPEELSFPNRSTRLKEKLAELAADKSRPNNALHAEALLVFHHLNEKILAGEQDNLDNIWLTLCRIIDRASGLGEFPADLLETMVNALSEITPDSIAFDELVEKLAEFMADRNKEITAGNLYLVQGERKLTAEKPIDGIKWLGRAVVHLSKEECREDQAKALYNLAVGYRSAGLHWAARATALASLTQYLALSELEGQLRVETIPALNLFGMLALQLGHVTDLFSAVRFLQALGTSVPLSDESQDRLRNQLITLDQLLACLVIMQPPEEIARLERIPDILEALGLFTARLALLYRLGHLAVLKTDGSIPENTAEQDIHDMMIMLGSQPACHSLPEGIVLLDKTFGSIRTKILGVEIEILVTNSLEGFLQAETYAAAFEGFAATLLNTKAFPYTEKLSVQIRQINSIQNASITEGNDAGIEICVPAGWQLTEVADIQGYNNSLIASCIQVLTEIAMLPDGIKTVEELVITENAFERATLFCRAGISRHRVFGTHIGSISEWNEWINQNYSLTTDAPPRPTTIKPPLLKDDQDNNSPQAIGEIRSHKDLIVRSIVDPRLWDAAKWKGMLYGMTALGQPPILGLMFVSASKGEAIFKDWLARFGKEDSRDDIRISVIKSIDRRNPFHYRGHITQNLETISEEPGKLLVNTSRMTTMTVDNHRNLEMFCKHLNACGAFFLVPAVINESGVPELRMEAKILKREFFVREAWQIGAHDIDMMAIRPDDDVVIPTKEVDPPVQELFKLHDEIKNRKRTEK